MIPNLSPGEKKKYLEAFSDMMRHAKDPKAIDTFIMGCINLNPVNVKRNLNEKKRQRQYTAEYFISPLVTLRKETQVCRVGFLAFFNEEGVTERRVRTLMSALSVGKPVEDKRGKKAKVVKNQYGEQVSEERKKRVCEWIMTKVPRRRGHYKGQSIYYVWDDNLNNQVKDELQLISHEVLLSQYNEHAVEQGWEQETISTWKRCWYKKLHLKGRWKFKLRKENCCEKCIQFIKKLREANKSGDAERIRQVTTKQGG